MFKLLIKADSGIEDVQPTVYGEIAFGEHYIIWDVDKKTHTIQLCLNY